MRGRATGAVAHAFHQLAVGDASRDEEHVVAADEIVGAEHPRQVVTGVDGPLAFGVVLRPELALNHTTDTLDRAGRDDPLRGAADAEQQVHAGVVTGGHDRTGDVAVADELDPRTGVAHLLHELVMSRPVQHYDGDVLDRAVLRLGHRLDVVLHRCLDVDVVGRFGSGDELLHVEDRRRVVHRAAVRHGHDRNGVVHALRGQRGPVDRVDRYVAVGTETVADLLAVVEHGRFVLLALADDDDALHRDGGDQLAHRVDRGSVGAVLVSPADPATGGHGGRFGHTDELEGEVAVGLFSPDAQRTRDSGDRHARIVSTCGCRRTSTCGCPVHDPNS